jgi:4a-hydroxytetrahydrobiopterin dehydratase
MKSCKADDLAARSCVSCRGGVPRLKGAALKPLLTGLDGKWKMAKKHHLEKEYRFKDFREALAFTNRVGALAEKQGHHPDLELGWGRVKVTLWTHKVDGLTENDFVMAAKIEGLKR